MSNFMDSLSVFSELSDYAENKKVDFAIAIGAYVQIYHTDLIERAKKTQTQFSALQLITAILLFGLYITNPFSPIACVLMMFAIYWMGNLLPKLIACLRFIHTVNMKTDKQTFKEVINMLQPKE